jgi:hypothetical protein
MRMDVNRLALIASILLLAIAVLILTDINGGIIVPGVGGAAP